MPTQAQIDNLIQIREFLKGAIVFSLVLFVYHTIRQIKFYANKRRNTKKIKNRLL